MANQFARPIADLDPDVVFGSTQAEMSGQPWWSKLDETTANDDTDYVATGDASRIVSVQLSPMYDPGIHSGHIIRARGKDLASSDDISTAIHQDNGDGTYTLIHTNLGAPTALTGSWATYTWTLTSGEAAAITTAAYLRGLVLSMRLGIFAAGVGARCTWVEFETPPAEPVKPILADVVEYSMDVSPAKTVRATLADVLEYSMLIPGTLDEQRLIDVGRQFRVKRNRLASKDRSVFIDFENL